MKFFKLVIICVMSAKSLLVASTDITADEKDACYALKTVFSSFHDELKCSLEVLQYFIAVPSTRYLKNATSGLTQEDLSIDPLQLPLIIQNWDSFIQKKKYDLDGIISSVPRLAARREPIRKAFDWTLDRYSFFMRDPIAVASNTVEKFLRSIHVYIPSEENHYGLMITEKDDDFLSSLVVPGHEANQLMAANVIRRILYDIGVWERRWKACILPGGYGGWSLCAFALGVESINFEGLAQPIDKKWLDLLSAYADSTSTRDSIALLVSGVRETIPTTNSVVNPFVPLVSIKRVSKRYVSDRMLEDFCSRQFMPYGE